MTFQVHCSHCRHQFLIEVSDEEVATWVPVNPPSVEPTMAELTCPRCRRHFQYPLARERGLG